MWPFATADQFAIDLEAMLPIGFIISVPLDHKAMILWHFPEWELVGLMVAPVIQQRCDERRLSTLSQADDTDVVRSVNHGLSSLFGLSLGRCRCGSGDLEVGSSLARVATLNSVS